MLVVVTLLVMLITGITSLVSHPLTLVGSAVASVMFMLASLLHANSRIRPEYLLASVAMCLLCLASSESNTAPISSTIHILACYAALAGLAVATPNFSTLCNNACVTTFCVLTVWVLGQTAMAGTVSSWTVTGTAASGNLMAAQLNMILPMMFVKVSESQGTRKAALVTACLLGMAAIICVGSRNGIGSLLITLLLIGLIGHIKSAITISSMLVGVIVMSDELLRLPVVIGVLKRFRFVGYQSVAPRSLIWTVCSEYISKYPWLGVGPGRSEVALAVIEINHAHNNIVQVALESGLPAAVIATLLFASLLSLPTAGLVRGRRTFMMCLSVTAYLIQSLTDIPLHHPQQTLLLVLCVCEARLAIRKADEAASRARTLANSSPTVRGVQQQRPEAAGIRRTAYQ